MNEKIAQFFAPDGTLISIPVKTLKRRAVLLRIAEGLSPHVKYSERDLNAHIEKFHPDTAALRRYMIENKILERTNEGVYWLADSFEH